MMVGGEGNGKGSSQDFELNLASIIDCLTVLIAFILASASFLSIGILDAGVAAASATPSDSTNPPPIQITLELNRDWRMSMKVSGKENQQTEIPALKSASSNPSSDAWDYEALGKSLASIKTKFPQVNAVILSADQAIEYRHVVKTMEAIRKTMPVVLLGGF